MEGLVMNRRATALLAAPLLTFALLATACSRPAAGPGATGTDAAGVGATGGLPSGTIVAFSGAQIPSGWTVCDGRATPGGKTTPDLRGRFVMGADQTAGDAGQAGGSATHVHDAETGPGRGSRGSDADNDFSAATGGHSHQVTVQPGDSLPPFVKLVYIMKD
jgi:hypothetical protein